MKYLLFVVLLLAGCRKIVESDNLYEDARVIHTDHIPSHTSVSFVPVVDADGNISTELDIDETPPKWIVVFDCQHGGFTLEGGPGSKAQTMYRRFLEGDNVIVTYRMQELVEEKDGVEVGRTFHDWRFVDARRADTNTDRPIEQ